MSTISDTLESLIDEDGDTDLDLITGRTYAIAVGGTFDTASLTFFFVDGSGNEIPVPEVGSSDGDGSPLTVAAPAVFEITAVTSKLRITAGSSGTEAIAVTATLKRDDNRE